MLARSRNTMGAKQRAAERPSHAPATVASRELPRHTMPPMSQSAVNTDAGPIYQRINAVYGSLPTQAQRVADLVLDHLGDIGTYSVAELAQLSNTSAATVSRLFATLGYSDFAEVKAHVRDLRREGIPVATPLSDVTAHQEQFQCEVENLRTVFESLSPERLSSVAKTLAKAKRVLVIGYHSSFPVAAYLSSQLVQARPNVTIPQPGQTMGQELADYGAGDAIVVCGFRRRLSQFGDLMRHLSATGATVIMIADSTARRHAVHADVWFDCPVDSPGAFDSLAAAMALCTLIAEAVLRERGAAGHRQVLRIAAVHESLSELDGEDLGYRRRAGSNAP